MKIEMKKGLKIMSIMLLTIILLLISSRVYARDNWAYVAGIKHKPSDNMFEFNSYDTCNNAAIAYNKAGYSAGGDINPDKATLWKNLYATVQFFMGHGGVHHINFTTTGIWNGNDFNTTMTTPSGADNFNVQLIGTNTVHWDADTILVSYIGCQVAGKDGNVASDSVTRSTALKGADAALGFMKTINYLSTPNWSNRYNEKLGEGYGVSDAIKYANSFSYFDNNVKSNTLWNHGDANFKIGKFGGTTKNNISNKIELSNRVEEYSKGNIVLNDMGKITIDKSMEERMVFSKDNSIVATKESINKELSKIYSNYNEDNYIIEENMSSAYNVNTNEKMNEYIYYDYKLKIGDYITDAAYTVVVKNNKIEEIYDNNVDIKKQEELLNNIDKMKVNVNYTYYYDIKNDKKYVIISYTTEQNINGEISTAIDSCKVEI